MKLKNAPMRKLMRQARALGVELTRAQMDAARSVRTKIKRTAPRH